MNNEITEEIREEILNHCQIMIDEIDPFVLSNSLILRNELLDFFYLMSTIKFENEGDYKLTYNEVNYYFNIKASIEINLLNLRNNVNKIDGITKNDELLILIPEKNISKETNTNNQIV